ncbi:hypothetical protein PS9374_03165 [Planomonospora sphaerica]|uniref:Antitoxin n=1 Tax=Planomonospora sphaerica TaxID=161355 RepID=A0A171D0L6_9ACTN|nr:hypothetical protein PS9374_03165 [Planomonospora sphaerica]
MTLYRHSVTITCFPRGNVRDMTKKIGVDLPDDLYRWMQSEVRAGRALSISGLIAEVVEHQRSRAELSALVADLRTEFGPPTAESRKRIDEAVDALCTVQETEPVRRGRTA